MRERVTISHRGAAYEIGRGRDSYAVWAAGAPRTEPLERWPATPEGWVAAWTRFTSIETPGTIVPAAKGAVVPGMRGPGVPGASVAAAPGTTGTAVLDGPGMNAPSDTDTVPAPGAADDVADDTVAAPYAAALPELAPEVLASHGAAGPGPGAGPGTAGGAAWYGGYATGDAGATMPVSRTSPRTGTLAAAGLLAAGVVLTFVSLFPGYFGGTSLASQAYQWVPHVVYLAAWAAAAGLLLSGAARRRPAEAATGALLAAGVSAVTLGLYLTDIGQTIGTGASPAGAGLWLGLAGWAACAAGSVAALLLMRKSGSPLALRRPAGIELGPVMILILAGLGAVAAFAPAWDTYVLRTAAGLSETVTAGNAFDNPGTVIAGDVIVMVAFGLTVIAAALWRQARLGVALLAGAVIPMAAQAVSGLLQIATPATPGQFGISSSAASQAGLTISSGLTAAFWLYGACVLVLIVSCVWLLFAPTLAQAGTGGSYPGGVAYGGGFYGGHPGGGAYPGAAYPGPGYRPGGGWEPLASSGTRVLHPEPEVEAADVKTGEPPADEDGNPSGM